MPPSPKQPVDETTVKSVYVGGVPPDATVEALKQLFEQYGEVSNGGGG